MTKVYLGNIQTHHPSFCLRQSASLDWLIQAHSFAKSLKEQSLVQKKILRFSCLEDKIATRYSEIEDFTHHNWDKMQFIEVKDSIVEKSLTERMCFYTEATDKVFKIFYPDKNITPPNHLIHVSCTGYVSPSAGQKLVSSYDWGENTTVTHCYHMGCYAAFPAIRIGNGFLNAEEMISCVDIVHTELCSLHFNLTSTSIDQHVVQSLFADGHAKYTLSSSQSDFQGQHFELLALKEETIPDTESAMTWNVSPIAFLMTISKSVPGIIVKNLKNYLENLKSKTSEKIDFNKCIFAIHPGGPKIISTLQETLSLKDEQIKYSFQILKEHGNMSSATLPHIWQRILDTKHSKYTHVISLAFGPGLTISGSIMRIL